MATNFDRNTVLDMNLTYAILNIAFIVPKQIIFYVLWVCIANCDVNSDISGMYGLPGAIFTMSAVENRKKP